jgi:putative NADH-flavin reductase
MAHDASAMTRILVVGASNGIGLATTRQALAAGFTVRAFARSALQINIADTRLEKVAGDALNGQAVAAALSDVDVVILAVGVKLADLFGPVSLFSDVTRIMVKAMTSRGVKRLICITGFGAGDSGKSIAFLQRIPFQLVFGRAYADKSEQERLIRESALDWTIVRPGILTAGPWTGHYRVLDTPSEWRNGAISRADVADFLVRLIREGSYSRRTPVLIS